MCELFLLKDAIPCECGQLIDIVWENGTNHYPMFPWVMDDKTVTYKCGACGKETVLNIDEVKTDKTVFGYLFNSEGYFSWKCPEHGISEIRLSSVPIELSEKLLVSIKNHYNLPCCIQLRKKKSNLSNLSFEELYEIHKSLDLKDPREEKWLSSASKEELVEYINYVILQESENQTNGYTISTKAINKNSAFFDVEILKKLYQYDLLKLWYDVGNLSDSKMVGQAIKKDCVGALDFYAERGYFRKESIISTAKRNAEKYGSFKCLEWLNEL